MSADSLRGQLKRAGLGTLVVNSVSIILGLCMTIVLARSLGPEQFGIYTYVFAIISVLSIPGQFGLPRLVVRETAKAQVGENWGLMRAIWRWSNLVALLLSLAIILIAVCVVWFLIDKHEYGYYTTFLWGVLLLPLIVLSALRAAALQGLRKVVIALLPERILRPGLLVIVVGFFWVGNVQLSASTAMALHVVVASIAFVIGVLLLHYKRPLELRAKPSPQYDTRFWIAAVLPLALIAAMQQVNKYADIMMLGYFMSAKEVGIYKIAVQGALLTGFGLQVIGMFISPYFARLHEQGDLERFQRLATLSARVAIGVAIPVFFVIYMWGSQLIVFFFGGQYIDAYVPLIILACGQLFHSFFGYVGIVLNMSGYQKEMARCVVVTAMINVVLNALLIRKFGIEGAALATTFTLFMFNLLLWWYAYLRLGIDTAAISLRVILGSMHK